MWYITFVGCYRRWFAWWNRGTSQQLSNATGTTTRLILFQMTTCTTKWLSMCTMILFLDDTSKRWGELVKSALYITLPFISLTLKPMLLSLGETKGCGLYIEVSWGLHVFKYERRCVLLTCIPWLGFFVDVNLFKANNKKAAELAKDGDALLKNINGALDSNSSAVDGLADEDSNLMVKLKFLTYKVLLVASWGPHWCLLLWIVQVHFGVLLK